jgi:putative Mg2+ transporter-C (MgtC) family protein
MTLSTLPESVFQLIVAVLVGALIGLEREYHDKSAGFRTIIFISVGSTLFTIVSITLGGPGDQARIAAQIVTGVGFLGAGTILQNGGGKLVGLTTAAMIWVVAAVGVAIGSGQYVLAGAATVVILLVLWVFPIIDSKLDPIRDLYHYTVVVSITSDALDKVAAVFAAEGLKVLSATRSRKHQMITCVFSVAGARNKHQQATNKIVAMPEIEEFHL